MTHTPTPKITFDGCGLNDLNDPFRKRLFTARVEDRNELQKIGTYIESACNAHEELVKQLKDLTDFVSLALTELDSSQTGWYYQLIQHMQQSRELLNTIEKGV